MEVHFKECEGSVWSILNMEFVMKNLSIFFLDIFLISSLHFCLLHKVSEYRPFTWIYLNAKETQLLHYCHFTS